MQAAQSDHDFDFWLGDWELTWSENEHGTNRVRRILDGAVIQEEFASTEFTGMSVSVFSKEDNRWHQTWVDSTGSYLDFVGGLLDGNMILVRDGIVDGVPVKQRMVWSAIRQDNLLWSWERSMDDGQVWQPIWKIQYQRKGAGSS